MCYMKPNNTVRVLKHKCRFPLSSTLPVDPGVCTDRGSLRIAHAPHQQSTHLVHIAFHVARNLSQSPLASVHVDNNVFYWQWFRLFSPGKNSTVGPLVSGPEVT